MPASGRGANLDTTRRVGAPPPTKPVAPTRSAPPSPRVTTQVPSINLRAPIAQHPFAPAIKQAARKVEHAQAALPPQPSPHLPYLPNPSPAQAHAALQVVAKHAQGIGPKAFAEQLANPRERQFKNTIQHYLDAYNGQIRAYENSGLAGVAAATGHNPAQGLAALEQSRAKALPQLLAEHRKEAENGGGIGPLKLATILPLLTKIANVHIAPKGIIGNLVNEAIDIPGQTLLSSAETGSAARSAIEGKPQAGIGLLKGIASQIEHPIRSAEQAPLSTALLFAGSENALGRLVGKVGRGVDAARGAESAVFGRTRPDLKLYGEDPTIQGPAEQSGRSPREGLAITNRQYNADPLRAALQRGYEKAQPKLPGPLRQEDPFQATGRVLKREVAGGLLKVGRVDRMHAAGELTRRQMVKRAVGHLAGVKPKVGEDAVPLILQRIVRTPDTLPHDLAKEQAKLVGAQPELEAAKNNAGLAASKANLARVEGLLADKQFLADPSEAFHAADSIQRLQQPIRAILLRGGKLLPEQLRASLYPYAQAHMGAVYHSAADHAALEQTALAAEKAAKDHVEAIKAAGTPNRDAAQRLLEAEAQHAALRQQRIDASGKHPLEVEYHERVQQEAKEAHAAVKASEDHVTKAQRAYDQLVQKQRHQRGNRGIGAKATAAEKQIKADHDAELKAARAAVKQAQADRTAKQEIARRPAPTAEGALRTAEGHLLTNQDIIDHMRANGVDLPGFLSHKPGIAGRRSFFKATVRFPSTEDQHRTGEAFRLGSADHSYAALAGSTAHGASDAAQLEVHARELSHLSLTPQGGFDTKAAAEHFIRNHADYLPTGERTKGDLGQLVPVNLGANQILDTGVVTPHDLQGTLEQFGLHNAAHESSLVTQQGKWGVAPEVALKRLQAHEDALGAHSEVKRAFQAYSQAFRHAKLNTSPRHFAGVIQEQGIRLGFEQALPAHTIGEGRHINLTGKVGLAGKTVGGRNARRAVKVLKAMDHLAGVDKHGLMVDDNGPLGAQFRELTAQLGTRGGLATSGRAQDIVRLSQASEQFNEGASLTGYFLHGADAVGRSKAGGLIIKPWHAWERGIEGTLVKVEHGTYNALLGKALKQSNIIPQWRSVLKMQDEAVQALVKGAMTPNKADALARAVDDMMGNWAHQTPAVRSVVGTVAPFGLWWLNSMRWLYRLPVTHPIKTGILAALYNATRFNRNAEGQGYDAKSPVPDFLQGAIKAKLPVVGNVTINPSYYSPGGTGGKEFGRTLAEQFLPQASSVLAALKGENPLNDRPLVDAQGKKIGIPAQLLNVLTETATGPVPFATQAQQLLQEGGKPYGTANILTDIAQRLGGASQIAPGTQRPLPEQLVKLLSPVRFNFPTRGSGTSGGSLPPAGPAPRLGGTPRQQLAHERARSSAGPTARQELRRKR